MLYSNAFRNEGYKYNYHLRITLNDIKHIISIKR